MSLVHAPQPLRSKTNTPRTPKVHFKLPVLHKSKPTVSVTNTNAARTNTSEILLSTVSETASQNCVPFPSTPIPCPSHRKRIVSEDGYDVSDESAHSGEQDSSAQSYASRRPILHTEILRRRSRSCLAASYFHHDSHRARKPPAPPEKPENAAKRTAERRESMSAGTPTGKQVRRARRVLADAQFLASMHHTVASEVRTRMDADKGHDECVAQDALLVERIWHVLVDMGYKPVAVETTATATAPSSPTSPSATLDASREAAERAARRTMAASSTPISPERAQDLPLAPTGKLAVPQLVAVLIMRHRDRSTTRPRSASKKRSDEPLSRSPLSITCLSALDTTGSRHLDDDS
ncbi:hypothetical protein BV20DRAFT_975725 [Pilatotrama ljubarskyi]|nr:hypothetical protein BV20DRAFT_975725 [Pilatotrama ljubarskyi]